MADITPRIAAGTMVIQSYAHGQFKISGQVFETPVIVTPAHVLPCAPLDIQVVDAVQALLARLPQRAEVVLIGTGASLPLVLPTWIRQARSLLGVSADIMDTPAACRTYNVLLTEGRDVAALLMPV